jgi:glycosyltransferase involved in cell wall biosynthesis
MWRRSKSGVDQKMMSSVKGGAQHVDVLIVHNIAWSHYKASVFSELSQLCSQSGLRFKVVDMATTERRRQRLSRANDVPHNYPHEVLWDGAIEEKSALFRARGLISVLLRCRPRILVVSGYYDPAYIVAIFLAKLLRMKLIVSVDSTEYDKPRNFGKEFLKRCILKLADGIFGYGSRSLEYCVKLGVPKEKITIRCQATDHERILREFKQAAAAQSDARARAFVYVGRVSQEKNLEVVFRAFHKVLVAHPSGGHVWRLRIVGDGPLKSRLEHLAETLALPVDFVGGVEWYEVPHHLAQSDVLILPSTSEPWGLVVNEAMICGRAVIVSDACGCAPDLVEEGINGYVFAPSNEDRLSELMAKFVTEEGLAERLGAAGAKTISNFTPKNAASQMMVGLQKYV